MIKILESEELKVEKPETICECFDLDCFDVDDPVKCKEGGLDIHISQYVEPVNAICPMINQ